MRFDGLKRKQERFYLSKLERSNRIGLKKHRRGRNREEAFLRVPSTGLWKSILAEQTSNGYMPPEDMQGHDVSY